MEQHVFQIGPIRPPSEANSLLLRVTENCPWNKCKFCMLYKKNDFHTRPVAEVKKDIDTMANYRDMILAHKDGENWNMPAVQKEYAELPSDEARMCYQMVFTWLTEGDSQAIFLQDANTMVLRTEWLLEIVSYVRERLPEIKRITSYGRANTLAKISEEDYRALRQAGLDRIHSGYESGSDKVLQLICKGATQEEQIIGGRKVRDAGIELSIYFMPGVGGRELSDDNALETAKVINAVDPDFVRLRTFVLRTGSLMEEVRAAGNTQKKQIWKNCWKSENSLPTSTLQRQEVVLPVTTSSIFCRKSAAIWTRISPGCFLISTNIWHYRNWNRESISWQEEWASRWTGNSCIA